MKFLLRDVAKGNATIQIYVRVLYYYANTRYETHAKLHKKCAHVSNNVGRNIQLSNTTKNRCKQRSSMKAFSKKY